jgi:hypothetical protein
MISGVDPGNAGADDQDIEIGNDARFGKGLLVHGMSSLTFALSGCRIGCDWTAMQKKWPRNVARPL